jgi:hypothetical protein
MAAYSVTPEPFVIERQIYRRPRRKVADILGEVCDVLDSKLDEIKAAKIALGTLSDAAQQAAGSDRPSGDALQPLRTPSLMKDIEEALMEYSKPLAVLGGLVREEDICEKALKMAERLENPMAMLTAAERIRKIKETAWKVRMSMKGAGAGEGEWGTQAANILEALEAFPEAKAAVIAATMPKAEEK